ncbi:uncharacterized protein LOC115234718 isoform X2 [Formica exsecta]|uniref:uncharacterized protein LOC115234718 isoform X2 n=1 Tax=Formica exsecta TaxID=72781 RepID=UPI00114459D2|nr:uncharacterized protein LOC115234718 isoform X2 [Formica exsecta]
MAKNVGSILLLTFVLSFAQADEHEQRRNTPPELTPESVVKTLSDEKPETRLLSFNPVTATVSLNAGRNNAHSVSLGASLDGISLSESNSYNHPTKYGIDESPVSVSKSTSVAAGLSGISTAGAKAYSDGSNAKTESHSHNFDQATATSFGIVENGRAITGAASSVGASQSSAATSGNRRQFFSQTDAVRAQYPYRPIWNNVGPNNGHNDQRFNRPTLTIWKPYDGTRPTLDIDVYGSSRREEKPTIHIHKWRPDHQIFSRPGLSIEHQPRDSWNDQTRGSTSFREYTSGNTQSWESASSKHVSSGSFDEDNSKGTSTSGRQGGNSVTRVNVQAIASSEEGFFPKGGSAQSQIIPLQYVGSKDSERRQPDSDILSDLAETVGELFDVL